MKLSSPPAALSFKLPNTDHQELRPPLTPSTEVDLQKSCAKLVQSAGYSRSFPTNSTNTNTQRRVNGTIPVIRNHARTPSKNGNKTAAAGHRRGGPTVRYEKTVASRYVPPRRPAPEKALPVARRVKVKKEEGSEEEKEGTVDEVENLYIERRSTEKETKSSDGSSVEEAKSKKGVKKLVNVMTGYIRSHDISPHSSLAASTEGSPSREKSNQWETLQVKSSKRKDGTTYIEALPEHLHTKTSGSDEDRKNTELKRNISKRLGHAMKEYVKPPHVDRFTPEPLHGVSTASPKEDSKKAEQKKYRVTKAMREYVKPSPIDITISEEEPPSQTSKPGNEKTPKSTKPSPIIEKPTSPALTAKDLQKSSTEPTPSKPATTNSHSHHNPFRLLHDYVKPSMTDLPPLQTNIPQASTHLSPILPSERRPLTPQRSQPSMHYVPPKIRPRGKTLPSDDNKPSPDPTSPNIPSTTTRQGPIFGGGYPVKQDLLTTTTPVGGKDKENRGPVPPGFFGRNPGGSGFRIHFSNFLNKQRSDGYDQLE